MGTTPSCKWLSYRNATSLHPPSTVIPLWPYVYSKGQIELDECDGDPPLLLDRPLKTALALGEKLVE